jgi:hypothetical protein
MRTHHASTFFAPSHLICPDCFRRMRLAGISPAPSKLRADEITYYCDNCRAGIKLVTGPVDNVA